MPKKKTTKKRATKKRATKATKAPRRRKAKPSDHISRAHGALNKVLEHVTSDDVDALKRVERMVAHALDNARGGKRRAT